MDGIAKLQFGTVAAPPTVFYELRSGRRIGGGRRRRRWGRPPGLIWRGSLLSTLSQGRWSGPSFTSPAARGHRFQTSFHTMERGLQAFSRFVPQAVVKVLAGPPCRGAEGGGGLWVGAAVRGEGWRMKGGGSVGPLSSLKNPILSEVVGLIAKAQLCHAVAIHIHIGILHVPHTTVTRMEGHPLLRWWIVRHICDPFGGMRRTHPTGPPDPHTL